VVQIVGGVPLHHRPNISQKWSDAILWADSFEAQRKELAELKQTISAEDFDHVNS
jgi:hypothetical protein